MITRFANDREEMQWLGGEAHVPPYNGISRSSAFRRWLASENILFLAVSAAAGAAIGILGTLGVLKWKPESQRERIG